MAAAAAVAVGWASPGEPPSARAGAKAPATAPASGIPFGPNELAPTLWGKPYSGTKLRLVPAQAIAKLRALRANGVRVTVKLVGPQSNYKNADGSFSLAKWKAVIDRFRGIDFAPYVRNGTIVAHQLVSEAKAPNQWGGKAIRNAVLEEMARYSKSIWPQMPTLVRTDALDLEQDTRAATKARTRFTWRHLDAASSRFLARKQDVAAWFKAEQASADRQGLALVVGLNVLSGGDGSSAVPSPTKGGTWTMSPAEIRRYGSAAMLETRACAFEIWQYLAAASYFARPDIVAAMEDLATLAAARPRYSCAAVRRAAARS